MDLSIFTIGHSNRPFDDFQVLLEEFQIQVLADVRSFPSSRKFPHFNQDTLRDLLGAQRIQYVWFEALGGLRQAKTNEKSPNTGLRTPAFRNYADHMMSDEFQGAIKNSSHLAQSKGLPSCARKDSIGNGQRFRDIRY